MENAHLTIYLQTSGAYPLETSAASTFSHAFLTRQHPQFGERVASQRKRIVGLLRRIVEKIQPGFSDVVCDALEDADSVQDADTSPLFDFVDRLRESTEHSIDEAEGKASEQQVAVVMARPGGGHAGSKPARGRKGFPQALALAKPQLAFEGGVDNARGSRFVPRFPQHGYRPLTSQPTASSAANSNSGSGTIGAGAPGVHPYKSTIEALAYQDWQLARTDPVPDFASLDDTDVEFVETEEQLVAMCEYLEGTGAHADRAAADAASGLRLAPSPAPLGAGLWAPVRELAIDLEAHSLRSFQGFTCLMQLSSRERDFLIDTLALRSSLHILNRLTTHPAVVKVLHGCDSDVVWLQRDHGIYLINVFDTGQAARVLAYPSFGLAHLLQRFANVTADKQYQTADWRQRPLPAEMQKYAREDTHYLLPIYDRLRNELIDASATDLSMRVAVEASAAASQSSATDAPVRSLLAQVLQRSAERTLAVYEKEQFRVNGYHKLMLKLGMGNSRSAAADGGSSSASAAVAADGGDDVEMNGDSSVAEQMADAAALALETPTPTPVAQGPAPAEDPALSPRTRVFAALCDWRDQTARDEDESTHYIMPNRLMQRIADAQPGNVDQLLKSCNPLTAVIRARLQELAQVVVAAKECVPLNPSSSSAPSSSAASSSAGLMPPPPSRRLSAAQVPSDNSAGVGKKRSAAEMSSASTGGILQRQQQLYSIVRTGDGSSGNSMAALAEPVGGWLAPPAIDQPRTTSIASSATSSLFSAIGTASSASATSISSAVGAAVSSLYATFAGAADDDKNNQPAVNDDAVMGHDDEQASESFSHGAFDAVRRVRARLQGATWQQLLGLAPMVTTSTGASEEASDAGAGADGADLDSLEHLLSSAAAGGSSAAAPGLPPLPASPTEAGEGSTATAAPSTDEQLDDSDGEAGNSGAGSLPLSMAERHGMVKKRRKHADCTNKSGNAAAAPLNASDASAAAAAAPSFDYSSSSTVAGLSAASSSGAAATAAKDAMLASAQKAVDKQIGKNMKPGSKKQGFNPYMRGRS